MLDPTLIFVVCTHPDESVTVITCGPGLILEKNPSKSLTPSREYMYGNSPPALATTSTYPLSFPHVVPVIDVDIVNLF